MKKLPILIATLGLAAAAPAMAQGWYAGLTLGQAQIDNYGSQLPLTSGSYDEKDTSYGGRIGYQINRHFAVEAGYDWLGKYPFAGTFGGVPVNGEAKARSYNVSAVGILPFSDRWAAYGKLGYGRTQLDASANALGFNATQRGWQNEALYGAGLKFNMDPQWGLFVEYVKFQDSKIDNLVVGATARF